MAMKKSFDNRIPSIRPAPRAPRAMTRLSWDTISLSCRWVMPRSVRRPNSFFRERMKAVVE